jgi:hypothetical protein
MESSHPFFKTSQYFQDRGVFVGIEVNLPESELGGVPHRSSARMEQDHGVASVTGGAGVIVFVAPDAVSEQPSTEQRIAVAMGVSMEDVGRALPLLGAGGRRAPAGVERALVGSGRNAVQGRRGGSMLCSECKNDDPKQFVTGKKSGDVTCLRCGVVAVQRAVHQGEWVRSFEGEATRSQHGAKPDPLMSSGFNLRTRICGTDKLSKALRHAQNSVEMNLSQHDSDERRTRVGYKDVMKLEAFATMLSVADSCEISDNVVARAKQLFADLRDDVEAVRQKNAVIAACLVLASRSVARERERNARAAAAAQAAEEETKRAIACLPRFRCNCVWEWEAAPGQVNASAVAKRRSLRVPKYKLKARAKRNGSVAVGAAGSGDGQAAVVLWRRIGESDSAALEEIFRWYELRRLREKKPAELSPEDQKWLEARPDPPSCKAEVSIDGGCERRVGVVSCLLDVLSFLSSRLLVFSISEL